MGNPERGAAYALWREVEQRRLDQKLTKVELAERAGIPRSTIDRLKSGKQAPSQKTVHALADALHIDRVHAEVLASLRQAILTPNEDTDVRAAIQASTVYTDRQRAMLLSMVDLFEEVNGHIETPGHDSRTAGG